MSNDVILKFQQKIFVAGGYKDIMDLISYYYFAELSKDLNMTHTASRLYISQQTLSNHIQRLEAHHGILLLERKPFLALTDAGREVLAFANIVCSEETMLKDVLSDIAGEVKGVLRFGASPQRMDICIPEVLPSFSSKYPNVSIEINGSISSKLETMVLNSELDYAVITSSGEESPKLNSKHLMKDQLYLCVDDSLLKKYYPDDGETIKAQALQAGNVEDFSRLPFFMLSNRMGQIVHKCFEDTNTIPNPYITSTHTKVGCTLCFRGLAACFVSQSILSSFRGSIPETVNVFPLYLNGAPVTQTIKLIWLKNRYVPKYAEYFMDLLSLYYSELEKVSLIKSA